jgi:hypothetical protein
MSDEKALLQMLFHCHQEAAMQKKPDLAKSLLQAGVLLWGEIASKSGCDEKLSATVNEVLAPDANDSSDQPIAIPPSLCREKSS